RGPGRGPAGSGARPRAYDRASRRGAGRGMRRRGLLLRRGPAPLAQPALRSSLRARPIGRADGAPGEGERGRRAPSPTVTAPRDWLARLPGGAARFESIAAQVAAASGPGKGMGRGPGAPPPCRSARDWVRRWLPPAERRPRVPAARRTSEAMDLRTDTLAHADSHHHTLLRHGDRWVAIDPKPIVGEPEFDVPAFLWNPLGTTSTRARTERRIRAFADAGLDAERIRRWAIVRGVGDGLPLHPGEDETTRPQLRIVRELL